MSKTQQLKLGWLFPYSGIFQKLKTDLEQGLALGWGDESEAIGLVPYPAFIQTGSLKDTEDALKKLLFYDEVDLVIGVISSKVALSIIPLLEKQRTSFLFLNLGADIPIRELSSPYLLYNSLHLWKSEWAMGKWAQQKYGGEPSINTSLYEGGYGLHEAFKLGATAAGAGTVKLNIVKNFSPSPDVSPLIQYLRVQKPQHVHALLSGKEGELFLRMFGDRHLGSDMALTVNPFMMEDDMIWEMPAEGDVYNAITWSQDLDNPANRHFLEGYQRRFDEHPHAFTLLAYEAGLALAAAVHSIAGKINRNSLAEALEKIRLPGPRGTISLSTRPLNTDMPIYIRQPLIRSATAKNKIIAIETGIEWNEPSFVTEQTYLTGWQNPYLCV